MVHDLAEYERAADQVEVSPTDLRTALFGNEPAAFAHVAEVQGRVVGMAVWFLNYSTWTGRHGIYLEDLFVRPEARGLGVGKALMAALAQLAVDAGYRRLDWSVLDWNEPAIGFYRSLGAEPMDGWIGYRLTGDGLATLAAQTTQALSSRPDIAPQGDPR